MFWINYLNYLKLELLKCFWNYYWNFVWFCF